MRLYIAAPLIAFVAYVLFKFINNIVASRRHERRARELGCKPAPSLNDDGPLGIYTAKRFLDADKQKRFPNLLVERFDECSRKEGRDVTTMAIYMFGSENYVTIDPRNIQAVLATQFQDFSLGKARNTNFSPLLGQGIFASDGKRWEHSRALLRPQFVRDQVGDLESDERHFQTMLKAIPFNADGWSDPIDLSPLFFRFTMDSATEFLFGESVNSQLAALPGQEKKPAGALDESRFAYEFDLAQQYLSTAGRLGDYGTWAHNKEFRRACKGCHDFIDHFVKIALEQRGNSSTDLEKGQKKKYIFLQALAQETSDPLELRYQLINILLAGRDTTASLLGWIFQLLSQHPETMKKLRSTVLEDFGTFEDPRNLSFASIKASTYLQHTVSEALRLYPPVPANSRRCVRDTTLPYGGGPDGNSPIYVKKDQEINYTVYAMHRRKDIWGADADEFRPERWAGRKASHPFDFLPFNAGPRICLGQQLAIIESSYVTVRLLQLIDTVDGSAPGCNVPRFGTTIRHGLTLTDCPADGVKVRLRKAGKV